MNSCSFTSEEDHHQRHCLDQEIGLDQLGSWRDNSQEHPGQQTQLDGGISEFDISIGKQQNEHSRSFSKQTNEPLQVCQTITSSNKDQKLVSQTTAQEQNEQRQEEPSVEPNAQTFFQQSNPSETVVRESVVQQKWHNQNGNVLNEFVYMNQHVYNPLLNNFKTMLYKTRMYSDKSVTNLDMYCLFFRIKLQQEQKRCQNIQNGKSKLNRMFSNNLLLDEVYLNEKSIVQEMTKRINFQADKLVSYCEPLQQASNKIKVLLSKTLQNRKKQIQDIETQLETIGGIQKEIIHLVTHPPELSNDNDSWFGKGDMRCDRYLQRRYLVEREHLFLDLLQNTGDKLVALLNAIFVQEQPEIHAVITRQMATYRKLSDEFYGRNQKQAQIPSKKIKFCDFNTEIFQILREIIPKEWIADKTSQKSQNQTEELIVELDNYLEDQIFLSSIQIDNTHIVFRGQAKWMAKSQQNQQQSAKSDQIPIVRNNQKQNPDTCQSSHGNSGQYSPKRASSNMSVNAILTIDRYLHMECGQKIASLKLKKLKLSRKGKAIQVSERNHSITNLFTSPIIFGELMFMKEEDAEKFIAVILSQK